MAPKRVECNSHVSKHQPATGKSPRRPCRGCPSSAPNPPQHHDLFTDYQTSPAFRLRPSASLHPPSLCLSVPPSLRAFLLNFTLYSSPFTLSPCHSAFHFFPLFTLLFTTQFSRWACPPQGRQSARTRRTCSAAKLRPPLPFSSLPRRRDSLCNVVHSAAHDVAYFLVK
jgi:hypothetical protein